MADKQILLLGSTNRKLATFSGDKIKSIKKGSCNLEDLEKLEFQNLQTLIVSVRPDLKDFISKIPQSTLFNKDLAANKFAIRGLYREFGEDRLCNIIGAFSITPEESIAVIDFGTCNTLSIFEWIQGSYEYRKGFICPGISSNFQYVLEKTASLPKVTDLEFMEYALKWKPEKVALSAKESIFIGTINQSLMFINHTLELIENLKKPTKLYITGGWAITVQSCLGKIAPEVRPTIEPNLGLLGGYEYLKTLKNTN